MSILGGYLSSVGPGVTIDTTTKSTVIGEGSGTNLGSDDTNNIAIGYNTLDNTSSGEALGNIAIGRDVLGALVGSDTGDECNDNIGIGYDALHTLKIGNGNVAIGNLAMATVGATSGSGDSDGSEKMNVAIGKSSLYLMDNKYSDGNVCVGAFTGAGANTTGQFDYNVALGYGAMDVANNVCTGSVAIGKNALGSGQLTAASNYSVGVGFQSLLNLTVGQENTAVGAEAGDAITDGEFNTMLGYGALSTNVSGDYNIAIGGKALFYSNASAGDGENVGIGYGAGLYVSTGVQNTFVGNFAAQGTTGQGLTGADNVCVGWKSGFLLRVSANNNVIMGSRAGDELLEGLQNVIIGSDAMTNADANESRNTAVGFASLYSMVSDEDPDIYTNNTALGYASGYFVGSGRFNTFLGHAAGYGVDDSGGGAGSGHTSGNHNTAVGHEAGNLIQGAAHSNTFVGGSAGNTTTTGVENVCLGYNTDIYDATATNQIVIGNNLTGTDLDNSVFIGNDTNHIQNDFNADATWSYSSDRRQKKDIEDIEIGLNFINDLKPVKYKHKSPSEFPKEWTAYDADDTSPMGGSDKYYYGFIAQDVKEAIDKYNADDYSAWGVNSDGRQRVSKESIIVTLVKAVQELSAQVEELKNK